MAITTYAELQTTIGNWLNRSDLTAVLPDFITLAEARMRRDIRLRYIQVLDFTASEQYVLPTSFKAVVDMYHDGATHYGPILMVSAGELSNRKRLHGDLGVPKFASVIDGPTAGNEHYLRFAPEPSGTYTLRMTYEADLVALSDSATTNWLLDEAPDLYLFAALAEAEGYLQEDQRVALWLQKYEKAADEYRHNSVHREFGGKLTPRPKNIIGEGVRNH